MSNHRIYKRTHTYTHTHIHTHTHTYQRTALPKLKLPEGRAESEVQPGLCSIRRSSPAFGITGQDRTGVVIIIMKIIIKKSREFNFNILVLFCFEFEKLVFPNLL